MIFPRTYTISRANIGGRGDHTLHASTTLSLIPQMFHNIKIPYKNDTGEIILVLNPQFFSTYHLCIEHAASANDLAGLRTQLIDCIASLRRERACN